MRYALSILFSFWGLSAALAAELPSMPDFTPPGLSTGPDLTVPQIPPTTIPQTTTPYAPPQTPNPLYSTPSAQPNYYGSSGGGGGPPPQNQYHRAFVVAVCAQTANYTQQCLNEGFYQAVEQLTEMYVSAIRRQGIAIELTVIFPEYATAIYQAKFLYAAEMAAVKAAKSKISEDASRLTPYDWSVERRKLEGWESDAKQDAADGDNWDKSDEHSERFKDGHAYRQLRNAGLNGWGSD